LKKLSEGASSEDLIAAYPNLTLASIIGNLLYAGFPISTTVKEDFEGKSIIKEKQLSLSEGGLFSFAEIFQDGLIVKWNFIFFFDWL
jgi:hypothetical protein